MLGGPWGVFGTHVGLATLCCFAPGKCVRWTGGGVSGAHLDPDLFNVLRLGFPVDQRGVSKYTCAFAFDFGSVTTVPGSLGRSFRVDA